METGIHEQASKEARGHCDVQMSGRRLWSAVLLQALEDWGSGNRRRQMEAESFFFTSGKDFTTVCRRAGLEPTSVLVKLQEMRRVTPRSRPTFVWSQDVSSMVKAGA